MKFDCSGYATKNDLKCSDGRVIRQDAFKGNDGGRVPLVWQHQHNDPLNVLGHAVLENREDGVYAFCKFNDTEAGKNAKLLVEHGDITSFSIFANKLKQNGDNVVHGVIRELSLVLSGANPGALIDNISIAHNDGSYVDVEDEAIIYTGLSLTKELEHEDGPEDGQNGSKTVQDVFDTMNEEQKNVVYAMLAQAIDEEDEDMEHSNNEGGQEMKKNVFDNKDETKDEVLSHSQINDIFADAARSGSLKESFMSHAQEYGIENIDILFPDARTVTPTPEVIGRRMEWVAGVLSGTKHSPFSRIKSTAVDITADEARAKGYVKGNLKKEEVIKLLKRVTTPTTIYKKQKLDRDDIVDITDLDVVAWLKAEMRMMLDEELARAVLIGDGREVDDEDKINEENLRPIASDADLYAHQVSVPPNVSGNVMIETIIRARTNYKGTGTPSFYTTSEILIDLLLLKDKMGRRLYNTDAELASALRVDKIIEVEPMESVPNLLGIIVNLRDYTLGADKGGSVAMFDDFDIDYNQYKYLIETRVSGCLTKPKSALVIRRATGVIVSPTVPTFVEATGIVTIPSKTGVVYKIAGLVVSAGPQSAIAKGEAVVVTAEPDTGYYFPHNTLDNWEFNRPE